MDSNILFLSQEDVKSCGGLNMENAINTMEQVFSIHDKGDYVLPNKTTLRWGDRDSESIFGRINSMPGYIGGDFNASGIKWISGAPQNPFKYDLPRAAGIIILNDPETLMPVAVMDGTLISSMRTGANSGVVARYLARKDSQKLGLIGAGVQNRTQLLALYSVLPELNEVKITDLDNSRAQAFANEMSKIVPIPIKVVDTAEEAVRASDVFVTATVTKEPIIKSDWVEEGSLYIHVGSHECEFDVIHKSNKVVVDDWSELKHRGVETISIMYEENEFEETSLYSELGEIVNNKRKGREDNQERIYFNSVGMGIEDIALASQIYKLAKQQNIGQLLSLWNKPEFV
ncbi:ornithine cyclodeaminase [Lentibacillus halodurans]|uniref:Ornithine cyclodeaminase n=1 Tax=Lentibacillus halodurans TaxID=237679 RepID=A0A1I0ZIA5_9BACI|nr:ornithine cyclodeaminase family protein [Lentibacillus halodurans]SFB23943.1 ornithine cyclodeaminase [Lentibacillus halodurans]